MKENDEKKRTKPSSAASGAVALVFLIIGFQAAVLTIRIFDRAGAPPTGEAAESISGVESETAAHAPENPAGQPPWSSRQSHPAAESSRSRQAGRRVPKKPAERRPRPVESFEFNPNTVSTDSLQRLGLSQKQAESIGKYRSRGGRFTCREDFKKMYVVSDSLYERLKDFISIPPLELNAADSAALTTLSGIGPWYAAAIIRYRDRLGGFHDARQLLEVRGIDSARLEGFAAAITVDTSLLQRLDLNGTPIEVLENHPYIGARVAGCIARYRRIEAAAPLSLEIMLVENMIDSARARKMKWYVTSEDL